MKLTLVILVLLSAVIGCTDGSEIPKGNTMHICRNFACEQPINSLDELKERLQ